MSIQRNSASLLVAGVVAVTWVCGSTVTSASMLSFQTQPTGLGDALENAVVDLTVVGAEDWVVFGDGPPNSNFNSGAPSLGTLIATNSRVGGTAISESLVLDSSLQTTLVDLSPFTGSRVLFDTDGNGSGDDQGGVAMRRNNTPSGGLVDWGGDDNIVLTVDASPVERVLSLWVLVNGSPTPQDIIAMLDVALGDGSAAPISSVGAADDSGGAGDRVYLFEIVYSADTDTTLTATLSGANEFDNLSTGDSIGIVAAATRVVPEPASLALLAAGGAVMLRRRQHTR